MSKINRRNFIMTSGVAMVPAFLPTVANASPASPPAGEDSPKIIKFFGDGESFEPAEYLNELQKFHSHTPIVRDRYGSGGAVEELEKKFKEATGKESAIYMPSGTMANQLALATLSGENTKVFVQETSHVYRDEADAAESVFNKRLMPLAKGETYFTARQLQDAIDGLADAEVFQSGIGAVSIENPVRRTDGRFVPLDEIKKISEYCHNKNIKLHLDGARIYLAAAWSGVSVKEYASYFDTVYISLYKYLGASGGAILCGDKTLIGKMPHLIKIHGGSMYGSWFNAAMALSRLDGLEVRLSETVKRTNELVVAVNKINGLKISSLPGGTNIYTLELSKGIDGTKMRDKLGKEYNIRMGRPSNENKIILMMNETLLYYNLDYVINAFNKSV